MQLCGDPTCESPGCSSESIDRWNLRQWNDAGTLFGLPPITMAEYKARRGGEGTDV